MLHIIKFQLQQRGKPMRLSELIRDFPSLISSWLKSCALRFTAKQPVPVYLSVHNQAKAISTPTSAGRGLNDNRGRTYM